MAKKTQKSQKSVVAAEPVEDASDAFSSLSDDFSEPEDVAMDEPEKTGHKVQLQKNTAAEAPAKGKSRGVVYVGKLPKQFQEKELRKYFSQFGELVKVRLARDRRSGASRLHGWVEFANPQDAHIAAETMDNYLMFGKMMKVAVVTQPPENLFPANMRENFTEYDWRSVEYKKENAPKPLEEWKALQAQFDEERALHMERLKEMGFDYSLTV